MREAPTAIPAQGGRITFPRWLVAADGDTEAARIRQMDELPLLSARDVRKYGEPGKLRGGFVQGGGLPFVAKATKVFGASGLSFEAAAVEITKDGAIAWDEVDTPSPFLRPIKTKRIRTFLNDEPIEGQTGLLVRGAKTGTLDNLILLPSESPLVAHWYGDRANRRSTRVYDVDAKGRLDKRRNGPLDILTVAVLSPVRGEFVPVLNGAADPEAPRTSAGGGSRPIFIGTQNSGGGTSTRANDPHRFTRAVPVYDPGSTPVDPTGDRTGTTTADGTTTTGGSTTSSGWSGRDSRLRYIEVGPKGSVHVGQVGHQWLVDGDSCTLHRYATVTDTERDASGRAGAIVTHNECGLHTPVGPNTGAHYKVLGNGVKDGPLKFDLAEYTATPVPGRMIETFIRHHAKDVHVHRGRKLPGLWKAETPCPTPPVITPGPKIGGGPVTDPNCLASPLTMQSAVSAPLPHPTAFGSSTLLQAVDCWPMDATAFTDENWKRISDAPWVGGDYGWATQYADGRFTAKRDGKQHWNPGGKAGSVGGFLRLPAGISPDCRGSSVDYETPRQGATFAREDIAHYRVSDSIARPDPVTGKGVDGIRYGQIAGSAGSRTMGHVAVDASGNEGSAATGIYRMEDQARLSRGAAKEVTIASDVLTLPNAFDVIAASESGTSDTITTFDTATLRDGDEFRVWAKVGHTITINEVGNALVTDVAGFLAMQSPDNITFRYRADLGKCVEVARGNH